MHSFLYALLLTI